ncbi:MAG: TRAP transporter large permease subunit [Spirochaetaceae bacterium]|nr:TRAP transporter large permease subunit [Spirochaetaceae bacterium]
MKAFVLIATVVMYAAIIIFPQKKAYISLATAAVLVIAGAVPFRHAIGEMINWNILLIYIGSLILAELFIYSRVPAFLADRIVERSPTLGLAIVIILFMTGLISAFVENVATVLLMAPIMLEIAKKLKMNPAPFMIGLAVMANLQGTATLVGDPPSMIFANYAGYSFNDFFVYNGKPSIFFAVQIGAIAGALYFYFIFRKLDREKLDLPEEKVITWVPTVLMVTMIAGLGIISGLSTGGVHASSGVFCLALGLIGLAWLALVRKEKPAFIKDLVKGLDWETILFLVGIFVVIGTLTSTGILDDLAAWLGRIIAGRVTLGFVLIVLISVLISGFVDNVPYIIAMLPVAAQLATSLNIPKELYMFGLLIGSCMGGNLTPFGASANVAAIGLSKKAGGPVKFMDWLKLAGPFTILTTAASSLFIYLIWR